MPFRLAQLWISFLIAAVFSQSLFAESLENPEAPREILQESRAEVVVIENKMSGKPLVCIKENAQPIRPYLQSLAREVKRPDYRLLDYRTKSGEISYEGPSSDRTKIYVFAATIATLGVVSGAAVGAVAASSAAAGGASSGGAGLVAVGTTLSAGTVSAALQTSKPDPNRDSYIHELKSEVLSERKPKTTD